MKKLLSILVALGAGQGLVEAQAPQTPTTLTASMTTQSTFACLASSTGVLVPSLGGGNLGSLLIIDNEIMQVTGTGPTSLCFKVKRGQIANSVSNAAANHGNGQKVWLASPTLSSGDPSRPFSTTAFFAQRPYQPFEFIATPTLFGVATTSVTDVNGQFNFGAIEVDVNMISTGACLLNGATVTTDKHILYLWDNTGTLIANTALAGAADAGNASVYQCQSWVTPVALPGPAEYFIGAQSNGTTDNFQTYSTGAVHANYPVGTQAGTFGTPASINPVPTTFATGKGPLMILQQ